MTEREQKLFDSLIRENKLYLHKNFKVNQRCRKGKIMSLEDFGISFDKFCESGLLDTYNNGKKPFREYFREDQKVLFNNKFVLNPEEFGTLSCGVPWVLYSAESFFDRLDFPVYFFLYPDGITGNPRMYIPTRGNIFHMDLKVSYDHDLSNIKKKLYSISTNMVSNDEIEKEGLRGIINGSDLSSGYSKSEIENVAKEFQNRDNRNEWGESYYNMLYHLLDYNTDWMKEELEDIIEGI